MPGLVAVVVLVGSLCLLNLVFTLGVVRRLREHSELLGRRPGMTPAGPSALTVGVRAGDYAATTTAGERVARNLLDSDTLVAFLTPGCAPCAERLPTLVRTAREWPAGQTLVVVAGDPESAADYVEALAPVARVVREPRGGAVARAFGVQAFPQFGVVDRDGVVRRSVGEPAELRFATAR
jgi:thiol-disulfide isomerase/thioredoxin